MKSTELTVTGYLESLPEPRKERIEKIVELLQKNLPKGFEEGMSYGMIGYFVPLTMYPAGYHCNPKLPVPFINLASQKNNISLYHMALYSGTLLDWFTNEWPKHCNYKLDMGKSCIRFKDNKEIPYALLGELFGKITPETWIEIYEKMIQKQ